MNSTSGKEAAYERRLALITVSAPLGLATTANTTGPFFDRAV